MKNVYIATIVAGFAILGGITGVFSLDDSTSGLPTERAFATGHVELMVMDAFGNVKQYIQSDNIVTTEGEQSTADLVLGTSHIATEALFDTVIVGTGTSADTAGRVIGDFSATQQSNRLIDEAGGVENTGTAGGIIVALWDGDNDNGRGDDLNNATGTITIQQVGLTSGGCSQTGCPSVNSSSVALFAYQADGVTVGIGQDDTLQVTWTITFANAP